jgi:pyruvate,water dikinase
MESDAHALGQVNLPELSDVQLAKEIERRATMHSRWMQIYEEEFIPMAHGIRLFGQVYNTMVRPADPYEFMSLLGATEMVSLKRNRMLDELAGMIREDTHLKKHLKRGGSPANFESFYQALTDFTKAFGDLSCGTDQCVSGEQAIIRLLLEMAKSPSVKRTVLRDDLPRLKEDFTARFPLDQQHQAHDLLDLGRASYRLRDDDNIYLGKIRSQLDRAVREARHRLETAGAAPASPEPSRDLLQAVHVYGSDSATPDSNRSGKEGVELRVRQIVGQPAGPGIASGKAQVIEDISELLSFEAGSILVCDALDPTMTFAVPLCEGIVERRGGMLIHGAIIAREYGLPCVTGISQATSVIRTGDRLTVDGYLGIVTIHRKNAAIGPIPK